MSERTYDRITFTSIGLVIGVVITVIIVWAAYATRSSIFFYCPRRINGCLANDYISDVDEALSLGYKIDDILFIEDGKLYFRRPLRSSLCIPQNPNIVIEYPKYCVVESGCGDTVYTNNGEGEEYHNSSGDKVILGANCSSTRYSSYPLVKW